MTCAMCGDPIAMQTLYYAFNGQAFCAACCGCVEDECGRRRMRGRDYEDIYTAERDGQNLEG